MRVGSSKTRVECVAPDTTWRVVKLGDIAEFIMGQAPPGDASNSDGRGTVFVKAGEFGPLHPVVREWTTKPLRFSKTGDVLICVVGATAGKLNLGIDSAIGRSVAAIRPNAETFDRFVYLQLQPKVLQLRAGSTGSAQGVINRTMLASIQIVLPPLPEQRRIVAEIEKQFTRLEAGVTALKRVQANLKRYRAAVLKAACEGKLVPTEAELQRTACRAEALGRRREVRGQKSEVSRQPAASKRSGEGGRSGAGVTTPDFESGTILLQRILAERRAKWQGCGKYREPVAPEPLAGIELPEGWAWSGFEQLADGTKHAIKAGPFGSSLKKSVYTSSGFKIYGQEQVIKGDPYFGDYFISRGLSLQLKSCEVKPGDILVSLVGTAGKVLILPDDCAPGIINPRLLKLSLDRSGVNPKFIKILLEATSTRAFFKFAAHGGTMEILNLGILKTLPIALPPLAEQKRIVAEVERRLSVIEELESVVTANLQRAGRLRQAVLKKSFSGDSRQ